MKKSEKILYRVFRKQNLPYILSIFLLYVPLQVLAVGFNVDAAGKAMFNPIVTFIDTWYGTGIFAAGVSGAIVSSGDLRTRALGFGIGSIISGLTLLGVKAGYDVKPVASSLMNLI
jgi:hypothetical protein